MQDRESVVSYVLYAFMYITSFRYFVSAAGGGSGCFVTFGYNGLSFEPGTITGSDRESFICTRIDFYTTVTVTSYLGATENSY